MHMHSVLCLFVWANLIPHFHPQRINGRSLILPPEGSGIPYRSDRRSPAPPWMGTETHLAAAVHRVGAKTETQRAFGRLLASLTTGYWSNPPRRGCLPSGQSTIGFCYDQGTFCSGEEMTF
ncbi:hypothetical protein XU18_3391 [Perkinsela sp. CCAP 1560/4]|nr:hypothetical protein XU18_3391 [Perkinsela sp. CCAP 1560/4]|eukprot:KNH05620.1 hypothetical protein XU18_3391 [Perkinsela sp. CCAP 1560/4]